MAASTRSASLSRPFIINLILMPVIHITSLSDPGVELFSSLTEAQLCDKRLVEHELFIAESSKVINTALDCGYEPFALIMEERHLDGIAAQVVERVGDIPIYVGSHELLKELTGFPMTRCILCAMRRPKLPSVEEVLKDAHRIVVIDSVTNTTNIGAIFRSAVALEVFKSSVSYCRNNGICIRIFMSYNINFLFHKKIIIYFMLIN